MLAHLRAPTSVRHALAMLAILALAMKLMVPPGFMPGSTIGQPIVLCSGQGPMMAMDHGVGHKPAEAPRHGSERSCAFSGLAAASLDAALDTPGIGPAPVLREPLAAIRYHAAPGRGMAAPPPPSHAPPAFRA